MDRKWRQFVFVTFPVAFMLVALVSEGLAYALRDVPLRRHDLDRLVVALQGPPIDAPIIILGDSITQDVLKKYRVAAPGQVANLATNKASGLVGAMFLLKRYLQHNSQPKHVVIASTPELFGYDPKGKAAELYLTSVFQKIDERRWLSENMQDLVKEGRNEPAVMNIEGRVGYKILALLAPSVDGLVEGKRLPAQMPSLERSPTKATGFEGRVNDPLLVSPSVEAVLRNVCQSLTAEEVALHIVTAPMPRSVYLKRHSRGEIQQLQDNLQQLLSGECSSTYFADLNEKRSFPDLAMRDADHLRRPGWTAEYARLLNEYIASLSL